MQNREQFRTHSMRRVAALIDGLQSLRVNMLLEQPTQLVQPVRYTRHQSVHPTEVSVLVAV